MTIDDAVLIAYADGELDPITRRRVEQALAADPALAGRAAAFDRLTGRVREAFASVAAAPVPDRFTALLASNVVAIAPRQARRPWLSALALAASLVLGVGLGLRWNAGEQAPFAVRDGQVIAAGSLARALDTQLASTTGDVRVLVSFRAHSGYCRVFTAAIADGIACHNGDTWQLRQTRTAVPTPGAAYRQAASSDAALMAAAQDMMVGTPLDAGGEQRARAARWR